MLLSSWCREGGLLVMRPPLFVHLRNCKLLALGMQCFAVDSGILAMDLTPRLCSLSCSGRASRLRVHCAAIACHRMDSCERPANDGRSNGE